MKTKNKECSECGKIRPLIFCELLDDVVCEKCAPCPAKDYDCNDCK